MELRKRLFTLILITFTAGLLTACGGDDDDDNDDSMETEATIAGTLTADAQFSTLVTAAQTADLVGALDDEDATLTLFAPTNDAFDKLGQDTITALLSDTDQLTDILQYHLISGAAVEATAAIASAGSKIEMANGDEAALSLSGDDLLLNLSTITVTDIQASNGVIHVIDTVLQPPADRGTPSNNIVETAIAAGNFTTLVTALQAAGLDSVLADESETYTVFAPSDDAFALIPEATLTGLLADTDALQGVLLQHVIIGAEVDSITAMTLNGSSANTAADEDVSIAIVDGELQIQGAVVTTADIYTSNGIIHVIDQVITETLE